MGGTEASEESGPRWPHPVRSATSRVKATIGDPERPPNCQRPSAGAMAAGAFHFHGEATLQHPTSRQRDGTVLLGRLERTTFLATA